MKQRINVLYAMVTILGALFSSSVLAQSCEQLSNTIAIVDCYKNRYDALDAQLNQIYAQAMQSLDTSSAS